MFNQTTLNKLQTGFKKGKLKGLSGIDPQRLSLSFDGPVDNGRMKINTARIKLDQKEICSFGFGKVPSQNYGIMFTASVNPQGYELSEINKKLKPIKVQAAFSSGQLLLLVRLRNSKNFFDDVDKLIKATQVIV